MTAEQFILDLAARMEAGGRKVQITRRAEKMLEGTEFEYDWEVLQVSSSGAWYDATVHLIASKSRGRWRLGRMTVSTITQGTFHRRGYRAIRSSAETWGGARQEVSA